MAKAFVHREATDPTPPTDQERERADEALSRVELYLGVDVEQAKEIVTRVLEDVS
jgi:hypothetical protein